MKAKRPSTEIRLCPAGIIAPPRQRLPLWMQKYANRRAEARAKIFVQRHCGELVARSASHIRSQPKAALAATIEEVLSEFVQDRGEIYANAFLECIEEWLMERDVGVATALHEVLEDKENG
jgi:hypothetical protein